MSHFTCSYVVSHVAPERCECGRNRHSQLSHVTHAAKSCHAYSWVMSHILLTESRPPEARVRPKLTHAAKHKIRSTKDLAKWATDRKAYRPLLYIYRTFLHIYAGLFSTSIRQVYKIFLACIYTALSWRGQVGHRFWSIQAFLCSWAWPFCTNVRGSFCTHIRGS